MITWPAWKFILQYWLGCKNAGPDINLFPRTSKLPFRRRVRQVAFFAANKIVNGQAHAVAIRHGVNEQEYRRPADDQNPLEGGMPHAEVEQNDERNHEQHPVEKKQRAEQIALAFEILEPADGATVMEPHPALIQVALATLGTLFAPAAPEQGSEFGNRVSHAGNFKRRSNIAQASREIGLTEWVIIVVSQPGFSTMPLMAVRQFLFAAFWCALALPCGAAPQLPDVASNIIVREESFWRHCAEPSPTITSRDLFAYALALCEAHQHPERLSRLFELAAQMQDRGPGSKSCGNFWWRMSDGKVLDHNAVDFSMRGGALLWLKYRDAIPPPARARLEELLKFAVGGCLRHQVPPSYSNIAIMNAGDLILLGEALNDSACADEGYARLDRFFHYTQTVGAHEFNSPTYTGVDLDGLGLIETYGRRESGRNEARALLEFFWTDVALNWFPAAQKLAGAQSRTYDYPRGLGETDRQLALAGWIAAPPPAMDSIYSAQTDWLPAETIRALSSQFPRLVRERWDTNWWQARTHFLLPDITLSSIGAAYGGRMDMPLTADLAGDRSSVRCYFIADGRNDPYGQSKLPAGAQQKAFHLDPFWTAAQRKADALGLVIYRAKDIPTNGATLASNFVMPIAVDSFWIGGQPVALSMNKTVRLPVKPDEAVAFRKGHAALALRVLWSRALDGGPAKTFLVYDGNAFGAARLAIEHSPGAPEFAGANAGAALWVRIGDGLETDQEFFDWLRRFSAAPAGVTAEPDSLRLSVSGVDGPVAVSAGAPWKKPGTLEPAPTAFGLELNGQDLGLKLLSVTH